MDEARTAFAAVGFSLGFGIAWWYFRAAGLLRTRREYYADRAARGLEVPEDWDDDD